MRVKIQAIARRPDVRWALVALLVYTLTTFVMMYPASLHLNSRIIGEERGDAYEYTHQLWWFKQALLEPGKSQTRLTLINHPVGIEHPFMLTMTSVGLLALPFSLLLSPAAVYNSQILLSFILSGMTMYWLSTDLTGSRKAGLVGGFIFAFFLNKTGHVMAGHLPQATTYLFPLYVLFLWRVIRKPGRGATLIAALVLASACLIHAMHLAYILLPITIAVLLMTIAEMRSGFFTRQRLGSLALVFGLATLMTAPFLLPTILRSAQKADYLQKAGIVTSSTDLLAFFTPSPYHPVLKSLGLIPSFAKRTFPDQQSLREGLAYPGILAAGLALWGLIRKRQKAWVWGALALAAAVLSLGPLLKVGYELAIYRVDAEQSYVVLPYALLKQLPLLQMGRTPGRLNEATMFAVAILAAYGMAELSSLLKRRSRLLTSLLALILIGTGFEYVAMWPFPTISAEIRPPIQSITGEPDDGALLYMGMTRSEVNHRALYYQTATQRPCVGGRLHRTLPETTAWWETLSGLARPDQADGDIIPRLDMTGRVAWLRHFDVDYVVLHRITEEWHDPLYRDFIETLLGPARYEGYFLTLFPIPDDTSAPESPRLYAFSDEGWHLPERDGDLWRRWMDDDGQMYLYSTREETGSLRFTADSYLEFPVLEVYLGEQLLDSFVVGERAAHTTRPFALTQGMNVLSFHAPGGCRQVMDNPRCWSETLLTPPVDAPPIPCEPESALTTCRTFVFDSVSFVPQEELLQGEALDINFGDTVRLRAWGLDGAVLHPGAPLTVTLAWEAMVELNDQYILFVHLLSSDGMLVAQYDAPLVGDLPSSAWSPGITFNYPATIALPGELPSGDYHLLVGVYLWPSLERLPVLADVPGAEARAVELGNVSIDR